MQTSWQTSNNLREVPRANYKDLADVKLPRARPQMTESKLYPVEIVEEEEDRVKVHYIGYDSAHDEWKKKEELEILDDNKQGLERYQPYNFYEELLWQIKNALTTRRDIDVRIEMGFDAMLYQGGLKSLGYLKKRDRGHEVYGIKAYKDLVPLFGENWHIRIKNKQLDFCYAKLETVEFYLQRRAPVEEFTLSGDAITSTHGGHVLTFKFVRMDGVRRHLDSVHRIK